MKRLQQIFVHNWRAKLCSLGVATVLWLVIKHGISYAPSLPPPAIVPPPPAAAGTPG